jgi:NAD(P)-dependent dehydrogenase (short-subunit alcohol dehydrogenase family)
MFNPSRDDVRRFFCEAWRKDRDRELLTPLEVVALKWIAAHPEYHALLDDPERALAEEFTVERGVTNPFLHLSMHLAIDEQLSIDQPAGVRALFERLAERAGDEHAAAHEAMECLGDVVWQAQRGTLPADIAVINAAYLECLHRRLGKH